MRTPIRERLDDIAEVDGRAGVGLRRFDCGLQRLDVDERDALHKSYSPSVTGSMTSTRIIQPSWLPHSTDRVKRPFDRSRGHSAEGGRPN